MKYAFLLLFACTTVFAAERQAPSALEMIENGTQCFMDMAQCIEDTGRKFTDFTIGCGCCESEIEEYLIKHDNTGNSCDFLAERCPQINPVPLFFVCGACTPVAKEAWKFSAGRAGSVVAPIASCLLFDYKFRKMQQDPRLIEKIRDKAARKSKRD